MWLFPDDGVGVFANINGPGLPNSPSYGIKAILTFVSDLALDLDPWLNLTTACTFPAPWRNLSYFSPPPMKKYDHGNMTDFKGIYGNTLLPDIEVNVHTTRSRGQYIGFHMNRIVGELLPTNQHDTFQLKLTAPWEYAIERVISENYTLTYPVTFERNENNDVIGFNITLVGNIDIMEYRKDTRFMDEVLNDELNATIQSASISFLNVAFVIFSFLLFR